MMKKAAVALGALVVLLPVSADAKIGGTTDEFTESSFFKKYHFDSDAKPYTFMDINSVKYWRKPELDNVRLEFDDRERIAVQRANFKGEVDGVARRPTEFLVDFIAEATGQLTDHREIEALVLRVPDASASPMEGKIDLRGFRRDLAREQRIGDHYVTIEQTIHEYFVMVVPNEAREKSEAEYADVARRIAQGDAESDILKGLLTENDIGMHTLYENMEKVARHAASYYEAVLKRDPDNINARCLLATLYEKYSSPEKAKLAAEEYRRIKPPEASSDPKEQKKVLIQQYPGLGEYWQRHCCGKTSE